MVVQITWLNSKSRPRFPLIFLQVLSLFNPSELPQLRSMGLSILPLER